MRHVILIISLLAAPAAPAPDLDALVARVMTTYGGEAAWRSVDEIHAMGHVASSMRGTGVMTRRWKRSGDLRVEIVYQGDAEVRVLERSKGTKNGRPVSGLELDAMVLQSARLSLPKLLVTQRASLHDRGVAGGLRLVEIPLARGMALTAAIDPKTARIVRSTGRAERAGERIEFITAYSDFRSVDGLLIPFHEENSAQGMRTGDITLDRVEVRRRRLKVHGTDTSAR